MSMTRQAATSCHQASQHWMGAHQPDQRLPLAQQHQGRRGQVQAVATATTGLTCFIFRFLRRPLPDSFRISYHIKRINTDMIHNTDMICKRYFWPASCVADGLRPANGAKQPFRAFLAAWIGEYVGGGVNGPPRPGKRGQRGKRCRYS